MGKYTYDDLIDIMARLRGENGCPWDRKQTHESLRGAIIEEVYEFADAVDQRDAPGMCEELGDILMLTVFHSGLAGDAGEFTNADVIDGICRKMISRHSHVFGGDKAADAGEALDLWNINKGIEKGYASAADTLRSVPKALPALIRAQKVLSRAERAEKGAPGGAPVTAAGLAESAARLSSADSGSLRELSNLVGGILWQIADFSRIHKINAEFALTNAIETFINRFEADENDSNHDTNPQKQQAQ